MMVRTFTILIIASVAAVAAGLAVVFYVALGPASELMFAPMDSEGMIHIPAGDGGHDKRITHEQHIAMLERWSFIGFLALLVYAAGFTSVAFLGVYYARNEEELRQS